jgi:hypothetical protein
MAHTLQPRRNIEPRRGSHQAWIDRCYLPLLVGIVVAVLLPVTSDEMTRIALMGGDHVAVAPDLSSAVLREVEEGELLCLRLDEGVAVTIDFADGRMPLVSEELRRAAGRARSA